MKNVAKSKLHLSTRLTLMVLASLALTLAFSGSGVARPTTASSKKAAPSGPSTAAPVVSSALVAPNRSAQSQEKPAPNVGQTILYDQTDNPGTLSTVSQMFEPVNAAFDSQLADDFVVPAGGWTVGEVDVLGVYFNGPGPATSVNVFFYADAAGLPGAAVPGGTYMNAAITSGAGTGAFHIVLPTSLTLAPGTYWVSVQANLNFSPGGEWGWTDRTVTSNSPAAWQNPGGGFATPCTGWGARGPSCGIDNGNNDQLFRLLTPPAVVCSPCNNPYTYTISTGTFVSGTTNIGINCDDCGITIPLPFPVTLYDQTFTSATAGSNGMLAFGTAYTSFGITCMPEASATYSIGPFWVDQIPVTSICPTCGVFTTTTGTAPNRIFYVEYRNVYYPGNATPNLDYEVVLYETPPSPGRYDVAYQLVTSHAGGTDSALTVGVQQNTTNFTEVGCDSTGTNPPPGVASGAYFIWTIAACPPAPVPTDAVSRKMHDGAGTFDVELPRVGIHGAVGIEDRTQGAGVGTFGWSVVAPYPAGTLEGEAVASDGTFAYVAGGFVNLVASNVVERYDPVANTWTQLANMPDTVYDARAAYAANVNKVYVFGGYNGAVINTTYIYDVASNTWTAGAAMPAARIWAEAAYYSGNGKIYVIGGLDSSFVEQSQTWEYDPVANTWNTTRTAAPVGEGSSNTAVSGQFIYLMGGYGGGVGSTNHYRYDILGDTWTAMASLPVPDRMAGSGNIDGKNYLYGGGTPSLGAGVRNPQVALHAPPGAPDAYTSTYIYDIAGNTWSTGPNMNAPHSWTNGAAIGSKLLVVAGYNGSTGDTSIVEIADTAGPLGFSHQMVVTFAGPVTVQSVSVTSGTGNVDTFTVSGNVVTVNLSGVTNAQRLGVTLHNVCDGTSQGDVLIPMGVLAGDTNASGAVNSSDVTQTKAQSGQPVGSGNFREDVNANGSINATDITLVKSKSGTALPP